MKRRDFLKVSGAAAFGSGSFDKSVVVLVNDSQPFVHTRTLPNDPP